MTDCVCLLQGFISGARLIAYHHSWESWPSELRITWDQQETAAAAAAESLQSCPTPWDSHRRQPTRLPRPRDSPGKNTGVGCHFLLQCVKVKSESEVAQSCLTLSDPMDCSPPGSSVNGIFQARVLEWGAIAFYTTGNYRSAMKTCFIVYLEIYSLKMGNLQQDTSSVSA